MTYRNATRFVPMGSGPAVVVPSSPTRKASAQPRVPLSTTTNRPGASTDGSQGGDAPSSTVVGAVGLLRHSQACRQQDTGNSPVRQRLSTLASPLSKSQPLASATIATKPATLSPLLRQQQPSPLSRMEASQSPVASHLYTNMSLDSALMGGIVPSNRSNYLIPPLVDADRDMLGAGIAGEGVIGASGSPTAPASPKFSTATSVANSVDNDAAAREARSQPRGAVTVVWDLDETLCCNRRPGKAILRPGAIEVLKMLRGLSRDPEHNCFVEIVLWTASMECVARPVIERLDPHGEIFNHLIFRDRRWYRETGYTKDLKLLGRDMSKVVIIENSPMSVHLNRKHSILVRDFMGSAASDKDLYYVKQVLEGWVRANGQGPKKSGGEGDENADEPTGIVEYLTKHPAVSHNNEILAKANVGVSTNSGYVASRFGGVGASAVTSYHAMSYFGGRASGMAQVPSGARSPPVFRSSMYARRL